MILRSFAPSPNGIEVPQAHSQQRGVPHPAEPQQQLWAGDSGRTKREQLKNRAAV